jgi:hypothetical protein
MFGSMKHLEVVTREIVVKPPEIPSRSDEAAPGAPLDASVVAPRRVSAAPPRPIAPRAMNAQIEARRPRLGDVGVGLGLGLAVAFVARWLLPKLRRRGVR